MKVSSLWILCQVDIPRPCFVYCATIVSLICGLTYLQPTVTFHYLSLLYLATKPGPCHKELSVDTPNSPLPYCISHTAIPCSSTSTLLSDAQPSCPLSICYANM